MSSDVPKKQVRIPALRMDKVNNRYKNIKFTGNLNNIVETSRSGSSANKLSSLRSARYQSLTASHEMKKNSKRNPSKEPVWNSTIKVLEEQTMKGPPIRSSLIKRPKVNSNSSMGMAP